MARVRAVPARVGDACRMDTEQQHPHAWPEVATTAFWEERYAETERVWSHRVNRVLEDVAAGLEPGSALDVGCGEGADAIWLARRGWRATGIDVSQTAVARARAAAAEEGLEVEFLEGDIGAVGERRFDLVTASFLHGPADMRREEILRRAATRVAPGGHLLVTSHAGPPRWAEAHGHDARFLGPEEELALLDFDEGAWERVAVEVRPRETTDPRGEPVVMDDAVILLRRR